jgi:NADH:ubiquinone oxidoreductase subunit F (NADH-binding)/(2Fe-2S) ferredoxin/ferredoxin
MEKYRANLMICGGTGCIASGGLKFKDALEEELDKRDLKDEFKVVITGCNGFCAEGPIMTVYPDGIFYEKLKPEHVPLIVEEHMLKGRPVEKFMYKPPEEPEKIPVMKDIPFFNLQVLRALRNKGMVDPEKIDEYIARDGYQAAAKALNEMTSEDIVKTMKDSGLRGRGGAGFLTGLKWELCARVQGDVKYILCNGDEGDPGAFMDRSIMEADPHVVLEGMIIAGKAISATKGYIYVRAEYPLAVHRLQLAIDQAKEYGLLGENILGSGYSLDIEIYLGAGAFVCGEETALMRSLEGKRGMPIPRPPFPAQKGLWAKPSVLNNVETFANIPPIILNGSEWYRQLGTEKSAGTKVFALTGAINNIGLIEVPMGIPLRKIIYDIGGGISKKRKFKAVQLGGPSGGCIPEHLLDTPVTYEDIVKTGAIVGSGGMVVMDQYNCMVSVAKFFLDFTAEESCGKCPPCRIGTKVMHEKLVDITEGRGKPDDVELLQDLSRDIINTSLCGLGQTAPNPVLTTIKYFQDEYDSHINEGWCKAGVCTDLVTFYIDEESCKGCGACLRVCPSSAITGEKKKPHLIDQALCIRCRSCFERCKFGSVRTGPAGMREEILKEQAVEA